MKKWTALLLCLALAVSLGACAIQANATTDPGASSGSTAGTTTAGTTTAAVTTTTAGAAGSVTVEVAPPDTWIKNESSVIDAQYGKGTASFMIKSEPFASADLDQVVAEATGIFGEAFDGFELQGEATSAVVDGKDARKIAFTCTVSKMSMKFEYYYLVAGGKIYAITFGDLADTFDANAADYEAILASIKFIEK